MLVIMPVTVHSMESRYTDTSSSTLYSQTVIHWPKQDMITLKRNDSRQAITYFIPMVHDPDYEITFPDITEKPKIGYASCPNEFCYSNTSTNQILETSEEWMHKATMKALFTIALEELYTRGFKKVTCTRKLWESPKCLASFISNPANIQIFKTTDDRPEEMTIDTKLP